MIRMGCSRRGAAAIVGPSRRLIRHVSRNSPEKKGWCKPSRVEGLAFW
jgi:hypothetical protein